MTMDEITTLARHLVDVMETSAPTCDVVLWIRDRDQPRPVSFVTTLQLSEAITAVEELLRQMRGLQS